MMMTNDVIIAVLSFLAINHIPSVVHAMSIREEMQLTDEQLLAFESFKEKAIPQITVEYMKKELVLIKYFRAAAMNDTNALELLKDNLKWRLGWTFDRLSEDDVNEYKRDVPITNFPDRVGREFMFTPAKYWDLAKYTATPESSKKLLNFVFYLLEETYRKVVSNNTKSNRTSAGIVGVLDLKGTDFTKSFCVNCISLLKTLAPELDTRWPGLWQAGFIVNAPSFLTPTINLIKPALSENFRKNGMVCDEDDTVWMPELLKYIPADRVPQELYVRSQSQPQPQPQAQGPQNPPPVQGFPMMFVPAKGKDQPPGGTGSDDDDDSDEKDKSKKKKVKKTQKKSKKKKDDDDDDDDDDDN